MATIQSIFGVFAESKNMQAIIDSSSDQFSKRWYPQYFTMGAKQTTLTYTNAIGKTRIEAAASVVDRNGKTPLRSRPNSGLYSGTIPAIKEKFAMNEDDYRNLLTMQALGTVNDAQLVSLIFNDLKNAGESAHKRIDMMCLEAISTGKITLDINNNPDGLVLSSSVDLLMPSENKSDAAIDWSTSATATPITDINTVIETATAKGISFAKILMSRTVWLKFIKAKEVTDTMVGYFYGPKPGSGFNPTAVTTLDNVNTYLQANQLPVIEIVNKPFSVEKDGVLGTVKPFSESNVSFIPSGSLGVIKQAQAIEEIAPIDQINYAQLDGALLSKWRENEPYQEFTKVEWNAFPAFEAIDQTYLLSTNKSF